MKGKFKNGNFLKSDLPKYFQDYFLYVDFITVLMKGETFFLHLSRFSILLPDWAYQ